MSEFEFFVNGDTQHALDHHGPMGMLALCGQWFKPDHVLCKKWPTPCQHCADKTDKMVRASKGGE